MAPSCIISEIKRDVSQKSLYFHTPPAFDAPISAEYCYKIWCGNIRMVSQMDGEKRLNDTFSDKVTKMQYGKLLHAM